MVGSEPVPRPKRKGEFSIYFTSNVAAKGWRDLAAVRRNDLIQAWETLTVSPNTTTPLNKRLRGTLGNFYANGKVHELRQLKLSVKYGARIWFYVLEDSVYVETVHTKHPNETK